MKRFLLIVVTLQSLLLLGGTGVYVFAADSLRRPAGRSPVFVPPILDALGGERVRYRGLDPETRQLVALLTYRVISSETLRGVVGMRFSVQIVLEDAHGNRLRSEFINVDPRSQGFLPPIAREDALQAGDRPVIRLIESTSVRVKTKQPDGRSVTREYVGFRVEAVRPLWGLDKVRDVYTFCDKVPVFGLVRWESRQPYPEWVGGRTLIWELNDFDWEAPR